jgi:tryptophanyl-tRNA synthetase
MTTKPNSFSGVQPSGDSPSLGNLIGAFKPFVAYPQTHNAVFCVVDHHAITVRQDAKRLADNTFGLASWYIAAGLDTSACTLFIQSHVSAHTELGWILNTFTQMGEMERMTQFKDKAKQHRDNVNVGLFDYPVLMAADILLYDTQEVPVGDDQIQHVELCRDVATRFNNLYGTTFVLPKAVVPKTGARIRDMQEPERKMSKSRPGPGTILLTEDPAAAAKKVKRAVTDSLGIIQYKPDEQPGLANLIDILASLTDRTPEAVVKAFEGQQYGALKTETADVVATTLETLQARWNGLMGDKAELTNILKTGADKARVRADATLRKVKDKVGIVSF